jgi:hypothetical protein
MGNFGVRAEGFELEIPGKNPNDIYPDRVCSAI